MKLRVAFAFLFCIFSVFAEAQTPELQAASTAESSAIAKRTDAQPSLTNSNGASLDAAAAAQASELDLRRLAEKAATENKLPVAYFLRLIGRESGFNKNAVSLAGAQGVAQFMPATARDRGLKDPLDPVEALPKSAELLNDLKNQFGNLGLAAAAYNAGPRRVQNWLDGRGTLPAETWHYVYAITGQSAVDWAPPGAHVLKEQDGVLPFGGIGGASGTRKNWELALLLSISSPQSGMTPDLKSLSNTLAPSPRNRAKAQVRISTRLNAEASLCSACIVQRFY